MPTQAQIDLKNRLKKQVTQKTQQKLVPSRSQSLQAQAVSEGRVAPGAGSTLAEQKAFSDSISARFGASSGVPKSTVANSQSRFAQIFDTNRTTAGGTAINPSRNNRSQNDIRSNLNTSSQNSRNQFFTQTRENFVANYKPPSDDAGLISRQNDLKAQQANYDRRLAQGGASRFGRGFDSTRNNLREAQAELDRYINERANQAFAVDKDSLSKLNDFDRQADADLRNDRRSALTGGSGVATTDEERVAKFLNLPNNQKIERDENGNFIIKSDDLDFEVDPVKRAEIQLDRQKERGLKDLEDQFGPAEQQIRDTSLIGGGSSRQSRQQLASIKRRRKKATDRFLQDLETQREDLVLKESQRQSDIEAKIEGSNDPLKQIEQQSQQELASLTSRLVNEKGLPVSVALGQARDMLTYKKDKEKDIKAAAIDDLNEMQVSGLIQPGQELNTAFGKIRSIKDAENYARDVLGLPEPEIKQQVKELQKTLNPHLTEADFKEEEETDGLKQAMDEIRGGNTDGFKLATTLKALKSKSGDYYAAQFAGEILGNPNTDQATKNQVMSFISDISESSDDVKGGFKSGFGRAKTFQGQTYQEMSEADPDASRLVESILQPFSNSTLKDIGNSKDNGYLRDRVNVLLSKKKQELLKSGNFSGVMAASAGGKDLSQTDRTKLEKSMTVLTQMQSLSSLLGNRKTKSIKNPFNQEEEIDLAPITGWLDSKNPWETEAQTVKNLLNSMIPNLARGVYGEVGVLTDKDVQIYSNTIANLRQTPDVQKAVTGLTLRTIKSSMEQQINIAARGGVDVSAFQDIYDTLGSKVEEIEQQLGINDQDFDPISDSTPTRTAFGVDNVETFAGGKVGIGSAPARSSNDLGSISSQYESNQNSAAIGWDSTGGHSYGQYQMTAKSGHAAKFAEMHGIKGTPGTDAFANNWRKAAAQPGFKKKEHNYIKKTHYEPQAEKLQSSLGIDVNNLPKALQDVVWSTAVQHGGNTDVIEKSIRSLNDQKGSNYTMEDLIKQIYKERSTRFPSSTPDVQAAVKNRYFSDNGEMQLALKQLT